MLKNINRLIICVTVTYLSTFGLYAQKLSSFQIDKEAQKALLPSLNQFKAFLAIPNDGNYMDQIQANVNQTQIIFQGLGFNTQVLKSNGIPHVYAEKISKNNKKSILFYLQIDGQPVDSLTWDQPSPYLAIIKDIKGKTIDWKQLEKEINPDYKVYARSASDSKGPAMCFITALGIINQLKLQADFNIKVIADFQEELSSPSISALVKNNSKLLEADYLLVMDGTRHISNIPTLNFGARGIATISLKFFGAKESLHSGQYGNYAPNPAYKMAQVLNSLKDEGGKVLVKGFYDGIHISDADRADFGAIPEDLNALNVRLGIKSSEKVGTTYEESMQFPSLNIRGIQVGKVGKAVTTTIPSEAIVEIDMRLVPETDGEKWVEKVKNHIEQQGVHFVTGEPTDAERAAFENMASFTYKLGSKPYRTEINSEIGHWLGKAMKRGVGDYLNIRATGGSQPMASFIETLNIPAVSIRIPNPDNNIHASNENIRIGNYFEGIKMCLAILTETF